MSHYARLADLPLVVEGYDLEPLERVVTSGWARHTTVIRLRGGGHEGIGEDVNWMGDDNRAFRESPPLALSGETTFDALMADGRATMEGDPGVLRQLMSTMVTFTADFEMLPGTARP